jgi:DNA mismatch repair protein MSH5
MESSSKRKRSTTLETPRRPSTLNRRLQLSRDEHTSPTSNFFHPVQSPSLRRHSPGAAIYTSNEVNQQGVEQDPDDYLEQIIMAVDVKEKETVGCGYYLAREEKLYLLSDVQSGGAATIEICMCHQVFCQYFKLITTTWPDLVFSETRG